MKFALAAIALGGLAAPVGAVSGSAPAQASADDAGAGKLICKARKKTGTRVGTEMCRTTKHWEAMAEANRATLKDIVDRPQIETCREGGGCHTRGY